MYFDMLDGIIHVSSLVQMQGPAATPLLSCNIQTKNFKYKK